MPREESDRPLDTESQLLEEAEFCLERKASIRTSISTSVSRNSSADDPLARCFIA
jgi:hypothetical protein